MTEVSVETCFTDLKVLSLSLNSKLESFAFIQLSYVKLFAVPETGNIFLMFYQDDFRFIG